MGASVPDTILKKLSVLFTIRPAVRSSPQFERIAEPFAECVRRAGPSGWEKLTRIVRGAVELARNSTRLAAIESIQAATCCQNASGDRAVVAILPIVASCVVLRVTCGRGWLTLSARGQ